MAIQNFFTSRDNNLDGNTYVGEFGRLWYNPDTNSIYASDGVTVGGIPIALATGADIIAGNIVANDVALNSITTRTGTIDITGSINLTGSANIAGNISPAAVGKIGGIQPGPGVQVSAEGILTIDAANVPLSFGDFTANVNVLTIVNPDEDMILATQGSAEIQLVGNVGFYKPDGLPPNLANRYFYATDDGSVHSKFLDIQSFGETGLAAPFNVTIDPTGNYRAPALLSGTIAQFTGNSGQRSFVVQDNYGIDGITGQTGSEYTFRTGRGTVDTPTAVQANDRLASIVATGWASNGYAGQASGFYRIVANENFTPTARGGRLEMWVVPNGTTTEIKITTVDGNGVAVIGTVSANGNVTGGNLITGGVATVTGNVTAGNVVTVGRVTATGNISTAGFFVGNGAILTGINAYGNIYANGVAILATTGSSSLTVTPGTNITVTGDNGLKSMIVGVVSSPTFTGNVTAGNLLTGGLISAAGNVTAGNLSGTNITGTLTTAAQPNITSVGTLSTLSVTGNITSGNIATGSLSASGNITGGNLRTTGSITATGNVTANNITATGTFTAGTFSTSGNVISGNVNGYVNLSAGTTTIAPLTFTAGDITTVPITGAMNYDGRVFYSTPQDSERGLMRSVQTYILNADYNLVDQTGSQTMFGVGTTVSTNTRYAYAINAVIYKTSNNISLQFALAGNATITRHTIQAITSGTGALGTVTTPSIYKNIITANFATPVTVTGSLNGTGYFSVMITGIVNVSSGGTWNPQVAFTGTPGAGSYTAIASSMEIWPIGAGNTTVSIGNWS